MRLVPLRPDVRAEQDGKLEPPVVPGLRVRGRTGKKRVDNTCWHRSLDRSSLSLRMSTTETKPQTLTPAEVPFTSPHYFNRCVTDTGKILPRKYTGLTSKYQRAVTKTLKRSRHMLLHK
jgi:small subunit ribosomal protein S18